MTALVRFVFLALLIAAGLFAGSSVGAVEPTAASEQSIFTYDGDLDVAFDAAAATPGAEGPLVDQILAVEAFSAVEHIYDSSGSLVASRLPGVGDDVVVIGKVDDLDATTLAPGERTLLDQLPDQGSPRANYVQNDSVLRSEMSRGVPIRDASVSPTTGELINNTGFLRAERDILLNHEWVFDAKTGYWSPPD